MEPPRRHDATAKDTGHEPASEVDLLATRVIDAAMAVHRQLGPGYLESIYEEAMALELTALKVSFERQLPYSITYRETAIGSARMDFLIGGSLVLELKAVESLLPIHKAQVISYLRMTQNSLGLLINFNVPLLKDGIRRVVLTDKPWRRGVVAVQSRGPYGQ